MSADDDLARKRFIVLNAVRILGLAMVLIGIAGHEGKLPIPESASIILVVLGFFEFFFMPNIVARKWRTPGE